MARPQTKQDLLSAGNEQYTKLMKLIDSMTKEEQKAEFNFDGASAGKERHWERDKNIRDVLIHLYEWHHLLLDWIESNKNGIEKPFLHEEYTWKTYGDMNMVFWEKHQDTPYEESKMLLAESHDKVMATIETFSNTELFEKKHYAWTGNTNVGSYCVSTTSSHYDWAIKKINKHKKSFKQVDYKGKGNK